MTPKWHKISFTCPECKPQLAITTAIHICADGEIMIEGYCPTCGVCLHFTTDLLTQMAECSEIDAQANTEVEVDDAQWLHRLHVKMPEKETLH
jgi:hypothetical protein